jgi:glycosyltransferase involved in cell wall biosynthesis
MRNLRQRLRRPGRRPRRTEARGVLIILENEPAWRSHRVCKQIDTLLEAGHRVAVITQKHPGNEELRKRREVRVLEYPSPPEAERQLGYLAEYGYSFIAAALLSFRAILSYGVGVVQFCEPPDIYFPLAWVLKWLGVRVLIDQRDLLPELYVARYGRVRPFLLSALRISEQLSHRSADHIICTNEYQRERAASTSRLPPSRVAVVRNGPVLAEVARAESDEALRCGRRYLCCWVGAMGRQDRVDLLIQSIDHAVHELGRTDCQFAIIGAGECFASMRALTHRLKLDEWVHFTGRLPAQDVFRYLASADLGLDASLQSDVSPVKLYEYMAFGLPVVAFDLQETRAVSDGAAVLAEAGNVRAHARAVDALLASPQRRRDLGATGQARIRQELAWDRQGRTYARVIQLLSRAGRLPGPERPGPEAAPGTLPETVPGWRERTRASTVSALWPRTGPR